MTTSALQVAKEALESLDVDKILSAYAENFLFEDRAAGEAIQDRSALRAYFQKLFTFPGVRFSDIRVFDGDDFAALEWTWSGVKRITGEPFHVRGASVIELYQGKICRETIYYDPRPALA
jgi:steroid delta-isomerase-like uncharacterized protein